MSKDITIGMFIEIPDNLAPNINEQISWILNEACSKIEELKCSVFYKMKDSEGRAIRLEAH